MIKPVKNVIDLNVEFAFIWERICPMIKNGLDDKAKRVFLKEMALLYDKFKKDEQYQFKIKDQQKDRQIDKLKEEIEYKRIEVNEEIRFLINENKLWESIYLEKKIEPKAQWHIETEKEFGK